MLASRNKLAPQLLFAILGIIFAGSALAQGYQPIDDGPAHVGPAWTSSQLTEEYQEQYSRISKIVTDLREIRPLIVREMLQFKVGQENPKLATGVISFFFAAELLGIDLISANRSTVDPLSLQIIAQFCETRFRSTWQRISCASANTRKLVRDGLVDSKPDERHPPDCKTAYTVFRSILS